MIFFQNDKLTNKNYNAAMVTISCVAQLAEAWTRGCLYGVRECRFDYHKRKRFRKILVDICLIFFELPIERY